MKLLILINQLLLVNCWMKNMWKNGEFRDFTINLHGNVQYLSYKKNGKYISFYNSDRKQIISKIDKSINSITVKYVVDQDIEVWNNKQYNLITYYDKNSFCTTLTDSISLKTNETVLRNFLISLDKELLVGFIITVSGSIYKIIYGNKEIQRSSFDFFIVQVEYYEPYIYILDHYSTLHVYSPVHDKVINTINLDYHSPVVHFYVNTMFDRNEQNIYVALYNKEIQRIDLINREVIYKTSFKVPINVKKIYGDTYKCIILEENNSALFCDSNTGEEWYRLKNICDINYLSRIYASHTMFICDGTINKLTMNYIIKPQKEEYENTDFTKWINKNPYAYLKLLMETQPYKFNGTTNN